MIADLDLSQNLNEFLTVFATLVALEAFVIAVVALGRK